MDAEKYSFTTDIFDLFSHQWALVSAGEIDDYNAMTIAWGGMGTLWGRPVVTVYVNPARYTYSYMEKNDYFTVSIYPEECRPALQVMGTKSGRDGDKAAMAGLTPVAVEHGTTFKEATKTFICRKIFYGDLDREGSDKEIYDRMYNGVRLSETHRMYIGEVVGVVE